MAEVLPHLAKHIEVAAVDLPSVDAVQVKNAEEFAAVNIKRIRARSLGVAEWRAAAKTEAPRWIARFAETKTIWHPAGV